MNDLAIWMAGHVSVPLYPTLSAGTVALIYTSRTTAWALETGLKRIPMTAGDRMLAHAVPRGVIRPKPACATATDGNISTLQESEC